MQSGALTCLPQASISAKFLITLCKRLRHIFLRGLGQLRKPVGKAVMHKETCMELVAKGWLLFSIALWERLQAAPSYSILGIYC